jgi:pimeloyl-ACP methyl ester carboxylesterase
VALFLMQNILLYPRWMSGAALKTEDAVSQAKAYGLVPWDQTTSGASAPQGYVLANFAAPAPRGTIVLFHGNGGWALDRGQYVDAFTRHGFRIFLYEYPGYGGRPGRPSEAAIVPTRRR